MSDKSEIEVVFDSRLAAVTYENLLYYRSSNIYVPPGCVALVEMTGHKDYVREMTFTAVRTPQPIKGVDCIEENNCIGKRYRRWKCCQSLGADDPDTQYDDYNRSVVRWGYDKFSDEIVEFEWIDRPGNYHLIARKCDAPHITDCQNPTIFEVSLIPANMAFQLGYDCYKSCPPED